MQGEMEVGGGISWFFEIDVEPIHQFPSRWTRLHYDGHLFRCVMLHVITSSESTPNGFEPRHQLYNLVPLAF